MNHRNSIQYRVNPKSFKNKFLNRLNSGNETFFFLDSSDYEDSGIINTKYNFLAGIGELERMTVNDSSFESLKKFYAKNRDWIFGYLSYDLKNETENLKSKHVDQLHFPDIFFFVPSVVVKLEGEHIEISSFEDIDSIKNIFNNINQFEEFHLPLNSSDQISKPLNKRIGKDDYIKTISEIKKHIKKGDIYELNFCQEFYIENIKPDLLDLYTKLSANSQSPFSCYCKFDHFNILSASPERFLKKEGTKIYSQPIKGTIRRGANEAEDSKLKDMLFYDTKERAENVMIVDLVRNDLSHFAKTNSVKVEELFGIYTFQRVHQMISTVSAEIEEGVNVIDVIKHAFPMGSMTGAPKIRAMELIEKYEKSKRGVYSGAIGYFAPDGNFDFNVVIRSMLYNQKEEYLSFHTGGAITYHSDPEKEYEECLLKAQSMLFSLGICE